MILGERVRLRAIERDDLPQFVAWLNDPEVRDGLGLIFPLSMTDENKWFDEMQNRPPAEKPFAIEARDGEGWHMIGTCSLFGIEWTNRLAELGIFIGDKALWNKGYGTDTVNLLVRHGFETLNLNRIWLRVHADNPRAERAYEKAGFAREGNFRQGIYKHGQFIDVHIMSILRDDLNNVKEK
jgi:RimJ/RimL family protein N-acetyltransferase